MSTIAGSAMMAAAVALLMALRPRDGQVVRRAEWLDVPVAITVTTGMAGGFILFVTGILGLWSSLF